MGSIVGTGDADTITGVLEADTITAGAGGDVITGGPGFDLFIIRAGDSPLVTTLATPLVIDTILDWSAADRILFQGGGPANFGSLSQGIADSYETAYTLAISAFSSGFQYSAIRVAEDVFLFSVPAGAAVRLAGANIGDVQRFNIVTGALDTGISETGTAAAEDRSLTAGADRFDALEGNDTLNGLGGNDTLLAGDGGDSVSGGAGNDLIDGGAGTNYLRGDDGDDSISGGAGFDDINGNQGNDTAFGGASDDWVVGGKDQDVLFGEGGNDIVYGNLGNDTLGGGSGNDIVRGGQGDDIVRGDEGNDTVAGDRGDDTISGGLGADVFLTSGDAGLDKVIDFSISDGDRVRLEPGTQYTLAQVDADVVITMVGGGKMVLEGVQLSQLPNGWIFGA